MVNPICISNLRSKITLYTIYYSLYDIVYWCVLFWHANMSGTHVSESWIKYEKPFGLWSRTHYDSRSSLYIIALLGAYSMHVYVVNSVYGCSCLGVSLSLNSFPKKTPTKKNVRNIKKTFMNETRDVLIIFQKFPSKKFFQENCNTPPGHTGHTPGNPPSQLWIRNPG